MYELLLQYGANINAVNKNGYTPLMLAINYKVYQACRYLIEDGANPYIKGENQPNAFELAKNLKDHICLNIMNNYIKQGIINLAIRHKLPAELYDRNIWRIVYLYLRI
jgi:ankyrin repeat protein